MDVKIDRAHGGPMIVVMHATLLVLAGGESRRMGRAKAWLEVRQTTLLRFVVDRLASAFSEVVISFAEPEQVHEHLPYRLVFDRKPSAGPLAGLEAGLGAARNDVAFAIACDMPYVTLEIAEMAVVASAGCDAAIPRVDGRPEPTCAAYRRSALGRISAALDAGQYKASDLAEQLDVAWLEGLDPHLFRSLNGPDDYERFRHELSGGDN